MSERAPSGTSPNWLELPRDITLSILVRVGVVDILNEVRRVCRQWRGICKDASMWRVVDMRNAGNVWDLPYNLEKMCMHAVELSQGGLEEINVEHFGTDELVDYIADRCHGLRRLRLVCCDINSDEGFSRFPLLEELDLSFCYVSKDTLEVVGRSCPLLKSFKLCTIFFDILFGDEEALAIAKNMPGLQHLQLFGNRLTNDGLQAILDGCPHLESLDLRRCCYLYLKGSLLKRCSDQIKNLRLPSDPTDDYAFPATIHVSDFNDFESEDEDYPSGISDYEWVSADEPEDYAFSGGSDEDTDDTDGVLYYGMGSP